MELLIPDKTFAKITYKRFVGKGLNIDHPITFNEKLWWLKIHYRNSLQTKCTDKYLVREYVAEKGLEGILTRLYGVYNTATEIPFDKLTSEVFIKCNHGSGSNYIF